MKRQIDAEIQKKNYEKELLLCKKAGGDIERYRRLSFNALQLDCLLYTSPSPRDTR